MSKNDLVLLFLMQVITDIMCVCFCVCLQMLSPLSKPPVRSGRRSSRSRAPCWTVVMQISCCGLRVWKSRGVRAAVIPKACSAFLCSHTRDTSRYTLIHTFRFCPFMKNQMKSHSLLFWLSGDEDTIREQAANLRQGCRLCPRSRRVSLSACSALRPAQEVVHQQTGISRPFGKISLQRRAPPQGRIQTKPEAQLGGPARPQLDTKRETP